jgi:iron complex outermembrane receptor protein
MDGESFGIELAADWQALPCWRLQGSYSYLQLLLEVDEGSNTLFKELAEASPHHQGALRSSLDLTDNLEWDLWWRYVGDLQASAIRHYQTLDARIAWRPRAGLELAVVGQNLLAPHHGEFASEYLDAARIEIERGVYGKATWQF